MEKKSEEQYWILGVLGFLGFSGINGFTNHDPWSFLLFCQFGFFGFFNFKYQSKAIMTAALLGVAFGLIMFTLGITGIIKA
jgi:hypothetical protein